MHEQRLNALGMGRSVAAADALLAADDQGDTGLAAEYIAGLGDLVDNLVSGDKGEVHVHELHDRTHADAGGAETSADKAGFTDRGCCERVRDRTRPQGLSCSRKCRRGFYVFAHDEDFIVSAHLLRGDVFNRHCI